MNRIAGLSYGHSLAYPHFSRPMRLATPRIDMLEIVLDLVHPGNWGPLPPSPSSIAFKGEQMGLGTYSEFFRRP